MKTMEYFYFFGLLIYLFRESYANLVCPNEVIAHGDTCYSFHNIQTNWSNARSWCRSTKGSDMLVVRNDDVYNDIKRHISQTKGEGFWLGASDLHIEGHFRWVDGSECCRLNWWIPGEPNDGGNEDCLIFEKNRVGFNDHECYHLSGFICEHKGFPMLL